MLMRIVILSFAILLPRILLIPVFVIVLGLATLALVLITIALAVISPFIAIVVAVVLGLSLAMIPMMIGIRLGFTTKGHEVTGTFRDLILPGAIYGAFEALGYLLIMTVAIMAFVLISSAVPPAELLALLRAGNLEAIDGIFQSSTLRAVILAGVSLLACSALRAAILVPLAGGASGRDANGSPHTPMAGFGRGFVPLTALVCISYICLPLLIIGVFALLTYLGFGDSLEHVAANLQRLEETGDWSGIGWREALMIGGIWISWIWIFCLQCAGAVLYFLKGNDDGELPEAEAQEMAEMITQDVRSLRKSRAQLS